MTGSFELNRLTADVNVPLNDDKTALFRINMAAQNRNEWQDQGHGATLAVAPSFLPRKRQLTLRPDADIQTYTDTSNTGWFGNPTVTLTSFDQFAKQAFSYC